MKRIAKKKIVYFLSAFLILLILFYGYKKEFAMKKAVINGQELKLEIASTDAERKLGLGGREGICQNCGMLFLFSQKGQYNFWMKDMRFPLDIVWILDDKVVYFEKNVDSDFSGILRPQTEADKVLELNTGKAQELNLKIGDQINL